MFSNTVKLVDGLGGEFPTAVVVPYENGKSTRSTVDGTLTFTIAHSLSNENPGFQTRRSVLRLQQPTLVPDTEKIVTPYVQITISTPLNTGATVDGLFMDKMLAKLVNFGHEGDNPSANWVYDPSGTVVSRLLVGEA